MDLKNDLEYTALRCGLGALGLLPEASVQRCLRTAFRAARRLPALRWQLVREQVALSYPELRPVQVAELTQGVYDHLARLIAETLFADAEALRARVEISPDWGPLDRALAEGRGAIVASAHLGNFELGGRVLARRHALLDVVKPQRNGRVDRYLSRTRGRHGIAMVTPDRSARAVLAHLRRGGVVSLLVDQNAGRDGVPVEFLNRPASAWPGAARISLSTGCPVVPAGILREADGRHVLHLGKPLWPPAAPGPDTVRDHTQTISAAVEAFIRRDPAQWFWVHRRWKGAADLAAKDYVPDEQKPD